MKRFLISAAAIMIFIAVVLAGIWLTNRNRESTVLTNEYDAPCWHGICPGQTTGWQAVGILEDMNASGIMQWDDEKGEEIAWRFVYPVKDGGGYIYSFEGQVEAISIQTSGSLTLTEALEEFGEPESMWMRVAKVEGRYWLEVTLVYPAQGVFVKVDIELMKVEDGVGNLEGDSTVGKVVYINPLLYEQFLGSRKLFGESRETIIERLQPWSGLGEVYYGHLTGD